MEDAIALAEHVVVHAVVHIGIAGDGHRDDALEAVAQHPYIVVVGVVADAELRQVEGNAFDVVVAVDQDEEERARGVGRFHLDPLVEDAVLSPMFPVPLLKVLAAAIVGADKESQPVMAALLVVVADTVHHRCSH